jgi:hypothetical protein
MLMLLREGFLICKNILWFKSIHIFTTYSQSTCHSSSSLPCVFLSTKAHHTRSNVNRIEIYSYDCRRSFTFSYIKTFRFLYKNTNFHFSVLREII